MQKKPTLYIIGGPARVGKSILAKKIREQNPGVHQLSTDSIRPIIRNVLVGEAPGNIGAVTFKGTATYQIPGDPEVHTMEFSRNDQGEDDLAWLGLVGLINLYDRQPNTPDILIEGVAITPKRAHELNLKNLAIKAAFIGYGNESHAKSISDHSKKVEDYIYHQNGGINEKIDEDTKNLMPGGIRQSAEFKKQAWEFGYGYFDVTEHLFDVHIQAVTDYLLRG